MRLKHMMMMKWVQEDPEDYPDDIEIEVRYTDGQGKYHREELPALLTYDPLTNRLRFASYRQRGIKHREEGATDIWYLPDGSVSRAHYYVEGLRSSKTRPSAVRFQSDGRVSGIYYYYQNQCHREDGPARIEVYPHSEQHLYYLHGQYLSKWWWTLHRGYRKLRRAFQSISSRYWGA